MEKHYTKAKRLNKEIKDLQVSMYDAEKISNALKHEIQKMIIDQTNRVNKAIDEKTGKKLYTNEKLRSNAIQEHFQNDANYQKADQALSHSKDAIRVYSIDLEFARNSLNLEIAFLARRF